MEIQSKFLYWTLRASVPWMKIPTTMFAYFHLLSYLPATSFTTVWEALTRTRCSSYLQLLILLSTSRLRLVVLQKKQTLKILRNTSRNSYGLSAILHFSLLMLKMSLLTRKSTSKRLFPAKKDSAKILKLKIEFVVC